MKHLRLDRILNYRSVTILLMVLMPLVFVGCTITPPAGTLDATPADTSPVATPSNTSNPLANTSWQLTTFGATGAETPVVADSTVTLAFSADGQAGGNAGCNSYGGSYQVQDDSLSFGELTSTFAEYELHGHVYATVGFV